MKTLLSIIVLAVISLTGCEKAKSIIGPSEKERAEAVQPDTSKQPAAVLQAVYGPKDLDAWYWQGVRDQAWSQHKGRPIYHVAVIDGRDVLFAPIETGPLPTDVEKTADNVLTENEKPLKRR